MVASKDIDDAVPIDDLVASASATNTYGALLQLDAEEFLQDILAALPMLEPLQPTTKLVLLGAEVQVDVVATFKELASLRCTLAASSAILTAQVDRNGLVVVMVPDCTPGAIWRAIRTFRLRNANGIAEIAASPVTIRLHPTQKSSPPPLPLPPPGLAILTIFLALSARIAGPLLTAFAMELLSLPANNPFLNNWWRQQPPAPFATTKYTWLYQTVRKAILVEPNVTATLTSESMADTPSVWDCRFQEYFIVVVVPRRWDVRIRPDLSSVFLKNQEAHKLDADPQVLWVHRRLANVGSGYFVFAFANLPSAALVKQGLTALGKSLDLATRLTAGTFFRILAGAITTVPTRHRFLFRGEHLYSANGLLSVRSHSRCILPAVTAASLKQRVKQTGIVTIAEQAMQTDLARRTQTVLVLVRASTEAQTVASLSLQRQLLTVLLSPPPQLGHNWSTVNHLCVVVEIVSSAATPWSARRLFPHAIEELAPDFLIAVNPDRVTRRSLELGLVLQAVTDVNPSGVWLASHKIEQQRTWTTVIDTPDLCQHLDDGCALSHVHGYYKRSHTLFRRFVSAEPSCQQVWQREYLLALARYHKICQILVYIRVSPLSRVSLGAVDMTFGSLTSQQTFLELFVCHDKFPVKLLKGVHVSATHGAAITSIENWLEGAPRTLVVVTSQERVSRGGPDDLSGFAERLSDQGHVLVTLLHHGPSVFQEGPISVDDLTANSGVSEPELVERATTWIRCQQSFARHETALPLTVPVVVNLDQTTRWGRILALEATRHRQFCKGFRASSDQGDTKLIIPTDLINQSGHRRFTAADADAWQAYTQQVTGVPNVEVRWAPPGSSLNVVCGCLEEKVHSAACRCHCLYCESRRKECCPGHCCVTATAPAACSCDLLCTCNCAGCHALDYSACIRCQVLPGCGGRGLCNSCYAKQWRHENQELACVRTGCQNKRQSIMQWCSIACNKAWLTKRGEEIRHCKRCQVNVVPIGTGQVCSTCLGCALRNRTSSVPESSPSWIVRDAVHEAKVGTKSIDKDSEQEEEGGGEDKRAKW